MFAMLAEQILNLAPDPAAVPGGDALMSFVRGLVFVALVACGAGLTLGAGAWGFGSLSTNPYLAMSGRRAATVSLIAAAIIGGSAVLIGKMFGIGAGIH